MYLTRDEITEGKWINDTTCELPKQGGIWRCRHRPFRRGSNWMLCAVMNVVNENSSDASAMKARMLDER